MATRQYRPRTADETPLGRRASGLVLALAIELLLLLAFLTLDFSADPPEAKGGALSTFDVAADREAEQEAEQREASAPAPPRSVPPPPPPKPSPLPDRDIDLPIVIVSKEVFAAADISKLGSNAPGGAARQAQPGDSDQVGTGPGGQPLYAAEWHRRPTHAQLAFYLPKRMPEGGGSGLVACRTAPGYRVEDCVELGSNPPGSRLAAAVRQAAWQFLVRPPRIGGKSLVGEWVQIRIDYNMDQPDTGN